MKSNIKKILILLGFVFIAAFLIGNTSNSNNTNQDEIQENEISTPEEAWFNNSQDPIYINAIATGVGAQNWTWARTQDWCRKGDGSYGNPYVIENVTINAGGVEWVSCIKIINSKNDYFRIQNCTVRNSGWRQWDAGITLQNTEKGTIVNNTCTNNQRNGILLFPVAPRHQTLQI